MWQRGNLIKSKKKEIPDVGKVLLEVCSHFPFVLLMQRHQFLVKIPFHKYIFLLKNNWNDSRDSLFFLTLIQSLISGVRRRTKEERDFAEFDIFDDPATPYSTFNFKYSHNAFERLSKLMEFNTLLNIEQIKTVIAQVVEKKKAEPPRCLCTLEDVPLLRRVSQKNKKRLSRFLSRIRSGRYSASEARKGIDKSIEEETINEEATNGSFSAKDSSFNGKFKRQAAISRKLPNKNGGLSLSEPSNQEDEDAERREIPGRRKPLQPEKGRQWADSRCFSIDEDDGSQFYTAIQTPSPR